MTISERFENAVIYTGDLVVRLQLIWT